MSARRSVALPDGTPIPVLGQGTWHMGEDARRAATETAALRLGLDLGMSLIDTAEMYGSGGAERVVAEAIAGRREEVFLVSKVLPHNATTRGTKNACEQSLKRLRTERIDLYLLHWRGSVKLEETVAAFERLRGEGKIADWGVSNFDTPEMKRLAQLPGGRRCAANQVLYHLDERGIEFDLLPWCGECGIPVMAYSPLGQNARFLHSPVLRTVAERHGVTPAAVAIAFLLTRRGVVVIPKAAREDHVRANAAAASLTLDPSDLTLIEAAYPPPRDKEPLAML